MSKPSYPRPWWGWAIIFFTVLIAAVLLDLAWYWAVLLVLGATIAFEYAWAKLTSRRGE
ncbi:hypothetical protein [Streptomyces sp. DH12]|uniref:hypothetical protein n=1 Tax=Streptomyces sp. DH12 TaxID=2857010 RepID=UPI001E607DC4|nr:hypothetical protein [Streptomyces sp. DH12]